MIHLYALDPERWEDFKVKREVGETARWRVGHFTVSENDQERAYYLRQGRDCGVGDFTALYYRKEHPRYTLDAEIDSHQMLETGWRPMMSDSKAEIMDHLPFLDKAALLGEEGEILITGLGLGMAAEACLNFGNRVTVVDCDPEVIELVASQIDNPRLRIIEADAWEWEPDRTFDLAWHDIWATITASNVVEMKRMKRKYRASVRYWQGCWAWERCKWMDRMENRTDPTGLNRMLADGDYRITMLRLLGALQPDQLWASLQDAEAKFVREHGRPSGQDPRHLFHALTDRTAPGERKLP